MDLQMARKENRLMTKFSFTENEINTMKLVIAYCDMVSICRNRESCKGCPLTDKQDVSRLLCDVTTPLELIDGQDDSKTAHTLRTSAKAFRIILDSIKEKG